MNAPKTDKDRRLPLALAAMGFVASAVLQVIHLRTYLAPTASSYCSFGEALDCAAVAASSSSVLLLPWATWGLIGFAALLAAAWRRSIWLLPLAGLAAAVSVALLVVELSSVGSICVFCEVVHVVSVVLAFVAWRQRRALTRDWTDATTLQLLFVLPGTLALTAWLFVPRYWAGFHYKAPVPFPTGVTEEGYPWIGAENPTLTVTELTSYDCPHCKAATTSSLRLLAKDPGLRIVRRQQPLMHCKVGTPSCEAARAAVCAGEQGKFWQADRWLFAHKRPKQPLGIETLSVDLKLDQAALRACMDLPSTYERVERDAAFARERKLTITPGYLVGDRALSRKETEAFLKTGEVPPPSP